MKRRASTLQGGVAKRPRYERQGTAARMPMVRRNVPAALYRRGPEVKTVDVKVTNQVFNSTGAIALMNGTAEGTSFYNRIGRRIRMKSIQISGTVDDNTATGVPANDSSYLRLLVVYDRQNNGGTPALADILLDVDSAGTTTTDAYSGLNMTNSDRFKVLMDDRIYIVNDNVTAGNPTNPLYTSLSNLASTSGEVNIKRFIKLNGLETHYGTANANAAGCQTGAVWMVLVASAGSMCQANLRVRVRYWDT